MKYMLTGNHGYRGREQFSTVIEADTLEEAKQEAFEYVADLLGGEDSEYDDDPEEIADRAEYMRLTEIGAQVDLKSDDPRFIAAVRKCADECMERHEQWRKEQARRDLERAQREVARIEAEERSRR